MASLSCPSLLSTNATFASLLKPMKRAETHIRPAAIPEPQPLRLVDLPKDGRAVPVVSDFFDFSVYLDADENDLHRWYVNRFMTLRQTAFRDPRSFFRKYAEIGEDEALSIAEDLWTGINLPNLQENILPTRPRADLVLRKGADHFIRSVFLRKL